MSSAETPAPSFLTPLVGQRRQVAIGLAIAGAVLAAISIWWGVWGFARSDRAAKTDGKVVLEDLNKPEAEAAPEDTRPKKSPDYQIACIWVGGLALLALLSSGWVYTQPAENETAARTEVVAFGGTAGLLTALFGAILGYRWYKSAILWIGSKDPTEAKWVLYAAAVFLAGLLIMFASLQLARSEERSNATLRRVLYSFSAIFQGLLLLLVLTVLNVAASMEFSAENVASMWVMGIAGVLGLGCLVSIGVRLFLHFTRGHQFPLGQLVALAIVGLASLGVVGLGIAADRGKIRTLGVKGTLVVNESAFTGLSDESKKLLHSFDRPVQVYLILPESHSVNLGRGLSYDTMYADCRGLLTACEDESPKFKATFLSPAFDSERIAGLFERLKIEKEGERDQLGMLVTVGDNEEARTFIRDMELISAEQGALVFQAESRLMTELAYLTDARGKEKVYFTQGHGELAVEFGGEAGKPTMTSMIQYLRDRKFTCEPLNLVEPGAKVPDDAGVVVVPGPRRPLGPEDAMFTALRDYVRRPDKPGKLFLCLPAFRDVQGKVSPTGLEPILAELGIEIESGARLVSVPGQFRVPAEYVLVAPAAGLDSDLARVVRGAQFMVRDTRPVRPAPSLPGMPQQRRVSLLMGTDLVTWQETDYVVNPDAIWAKMRGDPQLRVEKKFTQRAIAVAAAITETVGDKGAKRPRALVFGTDTFLQDQTPIPSGPEEYRQLLVSDGIDWLRERNATVGITPRKVGVFTLEKPIEWSSQAVLLGLVSVGITVLGVGVWLSRRR